MKIQVSFRSAGDDDLPATPIGNWTNETDIHQRLQQVIRLRHYSVNTKKTYMHRSHLFLKYHHPSNSEDPPDSEDIKTFFTRLAMRLLMLVVTGFTSLYRYAEPINQPSADPSRRLICWNFLLCDM